MMKKKSPQVFIWVILILASVTVSAYAASSPIKGTNVNAQEYTWGLWSQPVNSYLSVCSDGGYMRVQNTDDGVYVEYYGSDFKLKSVKKLPQELPVFGGFYETEDHYFLLTGQMNRKQSASVEVFRITKYNKNWKRLGSAGLRDCNTTVPFDAGCPRMTHTGDWLFVRTSHEMYQTPDGYNHQANVTIQLKISTMKITDSYTGIMNTNMGYVSHSFNQFIKVDNGRIVAVDHGDAHPRSIALLKYQTDFTTGSFTPDYFDLPCFVYDMLPFPGEIGRNQTGATVGGFEISSTSYLVAGSKVVLDKNFASRRTRNIYVSVLDKISREPTVKQITDYAEGTATCSNPHLVKLAKDSFLLLWSRENRVYYTKLDKRGNKTSGIQSIAGSLSDCVPIVKGSKVIWYTYRDADVKFYKIDPNQVPAVPMSSLSVKTLSEVTYTGKAVKPAVIVKNGDTTLKEGTHYTVSYQNNVKPGKASVTVKGIEKNGYSGTKTVSFRILPGRVSGLGTSQSATSIKASWKAAAGASGYQIMLLSSKGKVLSTVYSTKTGYTFSKLSSGTTYQVRVRAYVTIDGKKCLSRLYAEKTDATRPGTPTLKVTSGKNSASLAWNRQTGASGYIVYIKSADSFKKLTVVKGGSSLQYTKTGLTKGKTYSFKIRAYKTVDGKTLYGGYSAEKSVRIK